MVDEVIRVRDAARLVAVMEQMEVESAADSSVPKYAVHMLAYLLNNDLDRARLLWCRVPEKEKERNVELNHIWGVATFMLAGQRRDVYAKIEQHKWSNALAPLTAWLIEAYRDRNAALLARAYSNVSVYVAAGALGLEAAEAVAFLVAHDWTRDSDVLVAPVAAPLDAAAQQALAQKQRITAEQVKRLAEQVLFVEQ